MFWYYFPSFIKFQSKELDFRHPLKEISEFFFFKYHFEERIFKYIWCVWIDAVIVLIWCFFLSCLWLLGCFLYPSDKILVVFVNIFALWYNKNVCLILCIFCPRSAISYSSRRLGSFRRICYLDHDLFFPTLKKLIFFA